MTSFKSNSTGEFILLKRDGNDCIVQFIKTGTVKKVHISNVLAGKVKDQYYPTAHGVGYIGDFTKNAYWKQAKQLWQNMIKRCYCEKDLKGYFGRVTVCERWLCFANFLQDLPKLDNFENWLKGQNGNAVKYNLDKDFILKDNNVYAPELCSFVTEYENKSAGAKNGKPYTKKNKMSKN